MSRHSSDPACIFCKIVAGEIPSSKLLETDDAIAFLDINPVNHGHLLVIPKGHAANLAELSDDQAAHVGSLLPRLSRAVRAATGADGFNVVVNSGRVAGQTVDHCHFHIIPRRDGDPVHWPWPHTPYQGDELARVKSRIEAELRRG
ncbi:MAG: HIT family hydrolase, partial [Planctomycetes bacterium SCN 63-9]